MHPAKHSRSQQMMSVVQGLVQIWIQYESALHKEIARQMETSVEKPVSTKMNNYVDYGIFYRVSSIITREQGLTMSQLSSSLSVPSSTATRFIDIMVAYGYVKRLSDPDDRRIVRIALTPKGVELHKTVEDFIRDHINSIMSSLNEEEQESLVQITSKVISALEKAL